jgi:hypothetical protein
MRRTFLVGLALAGLVACGGGAPKHAATAQTKTRASVPAASRPRTRTAPTRRPKRKTVAARRDTTTARNPLTNH